jgi:hypothetical protein
LLCLSRARVLQRCCMACFEVQAVFRRCLRMLETQPHNFITQAFSPPHEHRSLRAAVHRSFYHHYPHNRCEQDLKRHPLPPKPSQLLPHLGSIHHTGVGANHGSDVERRRNTHHQRRTIGLCLNQSQGNKAMRYQNRESQHHAVRVLTQAVFGATSSG